MHTTRGKSLVGLTGLVDLECLDTLAVESDIDKVHSRWAVNREGDSFMIFGRANLVCDLAALRVKYIHDIITALGEQNRGLIDKRIGIE